ncbi:MAG: homoserine O-succinyltransferase [Oscillospiraceae bacterium]|nr:homoserine O-succinyltransferase [Oscillospiraceae bacterium]
MPIIIPPDLPAADALQRENIFYYNTPRALSQDIRMLHILLLNLMPTKIATETQFVRLLGNTPLQVEVELMAFDSHTSKNTSQEHMLTFYKTFQMIRDRNFDGLIITGAPIEHLPFEQADYWDELCQIMEWSKSHVQSTLHICWGAQAALYYHYGIQKRQMPQKLFGVFEHEVTHKSSILFRGFDDVFHVPHSRHTETPRDAIAAEPKLKILAESERAGVYAASTNGGRQIFITGHSEYDTGTLEQEYLRDKRAGLPIEIPENYYPNDDDTRPPVNTWRSSANLLFSNWLNYFVYQAAPYDIQAITPIE